MLQDEAAGGGQAQMVAHFLVLPSPIGHLHELFTKLMDPYRELAFSFWGNLMWSWLVFPRLLFKFTSFLPRPLACPVFARIGAGCIWEGTFWSWVLFPSPCLFSLLIQFIFIPFAGFQQSQLLSGGVLISLEHSPTHSWLCEVQLRVVKRVFSGKRLVWLS